MTHEPPDANLQRDLDRRFERWCEELTPQSFPAAARHALARGDLRAVGMELAIAFLTSEFEESLRDGDQFVSVVDARGDGSIVRKWAEWAGPDRDDN